jgi:hypothetical protein
MGRPESPTARSGPGSDTIFCSPYFIRAFCPVRWSHPGPHFDSCTIAPHKAVCIKPEENWLKCNVDGAIFSAKGKYDIGICFRESLGSLVQAHMVFPLIVSSIECEATTLQHALLIAVSCGFERVKFESDCQKVVNVVTNRCVYKNELESLL